MQSESSEVYPETSSDSNFPPLSSPNQYGLPHDYQPDPLSPFLEDQSGTDERSGSEWSLSASPSVSPAELDETRLNLLEFIASGQVLPVHGHNENAKSSNWTRDAQPAISKRAKKPKGDQAPFQEFPEELLFQVISHLPAQDLLTVKLVSRRFYNLVNSPHAWMHAFSKFFPGPDAMRVTADTVNTVVDADLRSTKRAFTRLTPSNKTGWTVEYLLRTRLLRCVARGRPAVPCASPAPGRPGKGMATFTYNSRLTSSVSHLHATFGDIFDKRKPQFIHGSLRGSITSSDKKGKFDSWGSSEGIPFRHFKDLYPESSMWGLGGGEVAGSTNSMDVSQTFGMVYGEGLPGGCLCYWPTGQKHPMFLTTLLDTWNHQLAVPKTFSEKSNVCCVWIAKTPAVPRMTQSLVGLLAGTSIGVLSAYSLGSPGNQLQRLGRGQLTARFALCPGVPIIAVAVDDHYSEQRQLQGRVWAVALNALGEVFYLRDVPKQAPLVNDSEENLELDIEAQAWRTGRSANWRIVTPSERVVRPHADFSGDFLPKHIRDGFTLGSDDTPASLRNIESWFAKKPADISSDFDGWDMRRYLDVDFAAEDAKSSGEVFVVSDRSSSSGESASITRYTRSSLRLNDEVNLAPDSIPIASTSVTPVSVFGNAEASLGQIDVAGRTETQDVQVSSLTATIDEWRVSHLNFGRYRNVLVQKTAMDMSNFALTTASDDIHTFTQALARGQVAKGRSADDYDASKPPGQRARFFAIGSGAGTVFLWNIRVAPPASTNIVSTIRPLRVINTQSPSITALALTSLFVVHGGPEGLVQAWDPLASTLEPIRTLTSRNTLNVRRRAVIASQQNPFAAQDPNAYAATAICLDPNPTVLRGIVAIGSYLRYWSFSSAAIADDVAKSQKRRMKRANRGLNASSPGGDYISGRRAGLKGFVNEEISSHVLEEKQRKAEEKRDKMVANRFGLNLLGEDASEEELLAYAKILSEEEHERKMSQPLQSHGLRKDATEDEVEAYESTLNEEEREEWKFASWERRFEMPASDAGSTPKVASTPTRPGTGTEDDDLAKAIQMSLGEASESLSSPSSIVTGSMMTTPPPKGQDDIERAIQLSLQDQKQTSSSAASPESYAQRASTSMSPATPSSQADSEDANLAMAIWRSLQGDDADSPANRMSPVSEEEFPVLSSPNSESANGGGRKGKGKGRNVW